LVDTAGLTPSHDPIERIGVERSREAARLADLLLLVLDTSEPLQELDLAAAAELHALFPGDDPSDIPKAVDLLVLHKSDLPAYVDEEQAQSLWTGASVVHSSTLSDEGMAALRLAIAAAVVRGMDGSGDEAVVSSVRHVDALRRAGQHLAAAEVTLA